MTIDLATKQRTLLAADPGGPHAADYAFDLGLALEGLQERAQARDAFLELAPQVPVRTNVEVLLVGGELSREDRDRLLADVVETLPQPHTHLPTKIGICRERRSSLKGPPPRT